MKTPKNHRKGIFFDVYLAIIILIFIGVVIAFVQAIFTKQAVQTIKFSEELSAIDTHLYVILNSNYCTPSTKLPFKEVIGAALSQEPIPGIDDTITIEYNHKIDTLTIKKCIMDFANKLYLDKYLFYVTYRGEDYFTIGEESGDMSIEQEDIAVPKDNNIATATLKAIVDLEIETDKEFCPEDDDMHCVLEKTCQMFGGTCKEKYDCGINQCCCSNLPI